MKRIYVVLFFLFTINYFSCYEDPFFKLLVEVVDSNFNTIEGAEVIISVQDQNGEIIEGTTVYQSSVTDANGVVLFDFDNLGFFAVQAQKTDSNSQNVLCGNSSVSLEENATKEITILVTEDNCN